MAVKFGLLFYLKKKCLNFNYLGMNCSERERDLDPSKKHEVKNVMSRTDRPRVLKS